MHCGSEPRELLAVDSVRFAESREEERASICMGVINYLFHAHEPRDDFQIQLHQWM